MTSGIKTIIRRYYNALWNTWNLEAGIEIICPSLESRCCLGSSVEGIDELKGYTRSVRTAYSDSHS